MITGRLKTQEDLLDRPDIHRFAHRAMATIFEVIVQHGNGEYAQQTAAEAFRELDRLERELSRFIANSDISRINKLEQDESVVLSPDAFACLQACKRLHAETGGAFDVTIGALMACWLNPDKSLRTPTAAALRAARRRTGSEHFEMDENEHRIWLRHRHPVHVDLGGFGKGYALDRMAELFDEWEIHSALLHGGWSSLLAMGAPSGHPGWPVSISHPEQPGCVLETIELQHAAVSGSGLQKGQHIIDPRTGRPVRGRRAAWAFAPSAALSDALSTAFMIMRESDITQLCVNMPSVRAVLVRNGRIKKIGF